MSVPARLLRRIYFPLFVDIFMKSNELASYRKFLGQSQSSFANILGASLRSIQAYEQGWREIPPNIERMILYLLYQRLHGQKAIKPCWEIKKCPDSWREKCVAFQLRGEGPCWFINGTYCEGKKHQSWFKKMGTCRTCPVFIQVMESKYCK